MILHAEPLPLARIRRDGQTQIRKTLDQEHIADLVEAYQALREVPPVLVFRDADGSLWLVDGFHRVEAILCVGASDILAEVRDGSLDQARACAAGCNIASGVRRTPGDKKRAVLLYRSTEEGARAKQTEIAAHCGVSQNYVSEVLAACIGTDTSEKYPPQSVRRPSKYDEVRPKVEAALREAPTKKTNQDVADEVGGVDHQFVRRVRKELDLPNASAQRPEGERAEQVVREHPEWTIERQSAEAGVSKKTIVLARKKAAAPAVPAKREDPRDAVEVIQAKPQLRTQPLTIAEAPRPRFSKEVLDVFSRVNAQLTSAEDREAFVVLVTEKWLRSGRAA